MRRTCPRPLTRRGQPGGVRLRTSDRRALVAGVCGAGRSIGFPAPVPCDRARRV
jgi:hypothetical protein